jgi:hypothetical protein
MVRMRLARRYVRRPLVAGLYAKTCPPSSKELFHQAEEKFASMKAQLVSAEWTMLIHGELERRLHREGLDLLRLLLQSHYIRRAQATPVESVVGIDGVERSHVRRGTSREVGTVFGVIQAERDSYSARSTSALHPLDAALNLPVDKYSHEVERQVALSAAQSSFDTSTKFLRRTTAAGIAKRQVEQLAVKGAADVCSFYEKRTFDADAPRDTGPLLILSVDQKGVVVRPEDLRPHSRKHHEAYKRRLQTRRTKGQQHGRKRLATVATVYTIAPHHRTADEFINGLRKLKLVSKKPAPRPELKRIWASIERSSGEVITEAFEEALKRDPQQKKQWYVLVDGEFDLEVQIRRTAAKYGINITIGLDIIHALEYLWKAGIVFHAEASVELEEWVLERLRRVLNGESSTVAAGMRRSATLRGLSEKERAPVDKCANYFLRCGHMMRYDELLAAGAPIATGVVEGACKYLVRDRLDISGARWSLKGAEAILRLRALIVSGDFDEYWAYHEAEEQSRNHSSRYADHKPPQLQLPQAKPRGLRLLSR